MLSQGPRRGTTMLVSGPPPPVASMPFIVPDWIVMSLDYEGYKRRNRVLGALQEQQHARAMAQSFPRVNLVSEIRAHTCDV